jgi:hypothetical protein
MTVTSKGKLRVSRRTWLLVFLFGCVLVVSLFYVFNMSMKFSSLEGAVHVKTERELVNAVDNAAGPIVIALDSDVTLKDSFIIPAHKDITLTSNNKTNFFKLIGAPGKSTVTVENAGLLKLAGVIVTHTPDAMGSGVSVNAGGTLVMVGGVIFGNKAYSNGGGVYNRGSFSMSGGKISDNYVYEHSSSRVGVGRATVVVYLMRVFLSCLAV